MFIIPKLQNIYWRKFFGELFSLRREYHPNCYFIRSSLSGRYHVLLEEVFAEHLSHALPTETIFYFLRSIPSTLILHGCSIELTLNMVETIVKWLQVSVSECNRQTQAKKYDLCLGTWF